MIFIDELPWMDTAKSGFIPALETFGIVGLYYVMISNSSFVALPLLG